MAHSRAPPVTSGSILSSGPIRFGVEQTVTVSPQKFAKSGFANELEVVGNQIIVCAGIQHSLGVGNLVVGRDRGQSLRHYQPQTRSHEWSAVCAQSVACCTPVKETLNGASRDVPLFFHCIVHSTKKQIINRGPKLTQESRRLA